MIYLIMPTMLSAILPWMMKQRFLWPISMSTGTLMTLMSLQLLKTSTSSTWTKLTLWSATDPLSTPLMMLSCWLTPISIMASMNSLKKQSTKSQRTFMSLMFMILTALILTFSSLELSLFYMAFETTLLPTLTLIARWGAQKERLQASMYFLFYTLAGSLPLLMALMSMYSLSSSLSIPLMNLSDKMSKMPIILTSMWWLFCLMAFTMKMPIYGFHLWLPKAHVEAPMAGSMMLAAMLLKLGGYGLTRTMPMFVIPSTNMVALPLITFCMWGALTTSVMCLRQTDLKALMAYSSVGHMSMVASGMFSMTSWGMSGALTLMIAHGLMSSAMFTLAKILYERKKTRTLSMTRGFKLVTPLLTLWWTMTCVSNLGLPPTPNLVGELLMMSSIMDWNTLSFPMMTLATVFGAVYSLLMLSNTKKSSFPQFMSKVKPIYSCEHLLLFLHLFPLALLMMNPTPMTI